MATLALPRLVHTRSSSPRPLSSTLSLDHKSPSTACPIPIPNKHIPVCPPGPKPAELPLSPPRTGLSLEHRSLLFPPDKFKARWLGSSVIYEVSAAGVAAALDYIAGQPLPDPSQVFPWLHGLHPSNHIQQAFFIARRRSLRKTPKCLRGITIVKAGGDLSFSRLKGAIAPEEFLLRAATGATFKEVDPKEGFSVRNFQIQTAKWATVSDIIVYGDDEHDVLNLAMDVAAAQQAWRGTNWERGQDLPEYNVFICTGDIKEFEEKYPGVVATNSSGQRTGKVMDFFHQERLEMCTMAKASEIDHNIWLGPTPDPSIDPDFLAESKHYDVFVECCDLGRLNPAAFQAVAKSTVNTQRMPVYLDFPSSGSIMPPTWSQSEADGILETCKWLYKLSHGVWEEKASESKVDADGDPCMLTYRSTSSSIDMKKVLIHCTDGYTESSLLGLAYFSYATGRAIPAAWLDLHVSKGRNFFAYPSDVALLTAIGPRLLSESPVNLNKPKGSVGPLLKEPQWIRHLDGSLPSRVTDYMYLGNLGHANNPELLRQMGINQLLSVGETASWSNGDAESWGSENLMVVQRVQDNGVDPLTEEFERCLEFIGSSYFIVECSQVSSVLTSSTDRGKAKGTATLVHCRVGVSRSATICIAEVMRSLGLSFPQAYCFVRARRLNVIIQPHLRFSYELLKWEEKLRSGKQGTENARRELEWPDISREIAAMNKPYAR